MGNTLCAGIDSHPEVCDFALIVLATVTEYSAYDAHRLVQLSHVCQRWRHVIIDDKKHSVPIWKIVVSSSRPALLKRLNSCLVEYHLRSLTAGNGGGSQALSAGLFLPHAAGVPRSPTANANASPQQQQGHPSRSPHNNNNNGGTSPALAAVAAAAAADDGTSSSHQNSANTSRSATPQVVPLDLVASSSLNNSDGLPTPIASGGGGFLNLSSPLPRSPGAIAASYPPGMVPHVVEKQETVRSGSHVGEELVHFSRVGATWVVEKLVFAGRADPNYKSLRDQNTPLIAAVDAGKISVVPTLLLAGAKVNKRGGHGATALLHAFKRNDITLAKFLLEKGADPCRGDALKETPFYEAMRADPSGKMLQLILATGKIDVNAVSKDKESPLFVCAMQGWVEPVRILIEAGADVNAASRSTKLTPLMGAIRNSHTHLVKLLLKAGADPNATTSVNTTPLMMAAVVGDVQAAEALIEAGAHMNVRDFHGSSALSLAEREGNKGVASLLRSKGVER